jgi:hypothetical protein
MIQCCGLDECRHHHTSHLSHFRWCIHPSSTSTTWSIVLISPFFFSAESRVISN